MDTKNTAISKITENVYHIYDSVDAFCSLIVGTDFALLIDSGYGFGNIHDTVRTLTDLPIKLINTHGHVDHTAGNNTFRRTMLHREDHRIYRKHSSLPFKLAVYLNVRKFIPENERNLKNFFKRNTMNITAVSDGDVIDIGDNQIEVIHTPGHTMGSICLLDRKHRILFSGDTFSSHVWLCLKESTTISEYIKTTEKVINRMNEFDEIISSHSLAVFKPSILPKIKTCAENLTPENSREYYAISVGKTLIYKEGFEEITRRYGYKNFNEFVLHAQEVPVSDIADIEFTSIVYTKDKLA